MPDGWRWLLLSIGTNMIGYAVFWPSIWRAAVLGLGLYFVVGVVVWVETEKSDPTPHE